MAWESSRKSIVGGNVWYFQGEANKYKASFGCKTFIYTNKQNKKEKHRCMHAVNYCCKSTV